MAGKNRNKTRKTKTKNKNQNQARKAASGTGRQSSQTTANRRGRIAIGVVIGILMVLTALAPLLYALAMLA